MSDHFREGHYLLGIEGLALLRAGADRRLTDVEARMLDIKEILGRLDEAPYSERRDLPAFDVGQGYSGWAESYDDPGNDTIALEEPAVRELLDDLPPGTILDAACGTGRYAAYMSAAGREVVGIDGSEAMLERARAKLPDLDLRRGELTALPFADGTFAGVVCALALSHLPEIEAAISELGRVLQPGGRLVISNPHPFATGVLGWRAVFRDGQGRRSTISEYPHLHGDYLEAFAAAGLVPTRLIEPRIDRDGARSRAKADRQVAFEQALTGLPAVIVWEAERS